MEKGSPSEQEVAAKIVLQILDILLKSEHSINNEQVSDRFFVHFSIQKLANWIGFQFDLWPWILNEWMSSNTPKTDKILIVYSIFNEICYSNNVFLRQLLNIFAAFLKTFNSATTNHSNLLKSHHYTINVSRYATTQFQIIYFNLHVWQSMKFIIENFALEATLIRIKTVYWLNVYDDNGC